MQLQHREMIKELVPTNKFSTGLKPRKCARTKNEKKYKEMIRMHLLDRVRDRKRESRSLMAAEQSSHDGFPKRQKHTGKHGTVGVHLM